MKKQRVLVLVHETLVPPDDSSGYTEQEIDEWRTEYDVTTSLRAMGHEVKVLGLGNNLADLRNAITDWKPDIAFNLLEEFQGIVTHDQYVVAFLELMRMPYTGCNPRGMMISRDKVLSKQILAYHRIPTARFALLPRNRRYREPRRLKFPLFVKSATEDASLGISQASIVHDGQKLRERVEFIHDQTNSDALVEEYIEGREIYVGVMGNDRLTTFPLWELNFGTLPEVMAGIATRKVKWDRKYQKKHGIGTGPALELPEGMQQRVAQLARRIYRALFLSGYARIDLRVREDGSVFVLEANANPNLAQIEDFATSALAASVGYDELLERIMKIGSGYQAAWRQA
ncbi:MAG: D-alanine--D-alanine ligase [Gammaproteobacteria bacterium]|nr:D-alanine--D-alanine ligase [Gammaproteobacteria bacterium]